MTDETTVATTETAAPVETVPATVTITPVEPVAEPSLKEDLANVEHAIVQLAEDVVTEAKDAL